MNWENAFSLERGAYADYRNKAYDGPFINNGEQSIYVSKKRNIFTTGLSTEGVFTNNSAKKMTKLGYRVFVGYSPKLKNSFKAADGDISYLEGGTAVVASLFYQNQKIFGILEVNNQFNFGAKLSVGYSF